MKQQIHGENAPGNERERLHAGVHRRKKGKLIGLYRTGDPPELLGVLL